MALVDVRFAEGTPTNVRAIWITSSACSHYRLRCGCWRAIQGGESTLSMPSSRVGPVLRAGQSMPLGDCGPARADGTEGSDEVRTPVSSPYGHERCRRPC